MSISSIGNRPDQAMLQLKQSGDRGKSSIAQELKEKITRINTGETAQVQEDGQQEKGVVGLLQEGHFQGVADVRLRINFSEQLQLAVSQKSGEVLRTESRELMVELESKVQSVGEEFDVMDQIEDLLTNFKEEAEDLLGAAEGGGDSSSVIGGLRGAFAGFLASLQSIAPADDVNDAEGNNGVAGEEALAGIEELLENGAPAMGTEGSTETTEPAPTGEPDAFLAALQNLQEWFDAEIAALDKTVKDLQVLPEPSEPRGNGVAYDRFLEIYKELEAGTGSNRTHGKA